PHLARRMRAPRSTSLVDMCHTPYPPRSSLAVRHIPAAPRTLVPGHERNTWPLRAVTDIGQIWVRHACSCSRTASDRPAYERTEHAHMATIEAPYSKPVRVTLYVADLKCYLCGSVTGSIESEHSLTDAGRAGEPVAL